MSTEVKQRIYFFLLAALLGLLPFFGVVALIRPFFSTFAAGAADAADAVGAALLDVFVAAEADAGAAAFALPFDPLAGAFFFGDAAFFFGALLALAAFGFAGALAFGLAAKEEENVDQCHRIDFNTNRLSLFLVLQRLSSC